MKKLRYIQQLDSWGCSIACMAMLVDMNYFSLRQFLYENDDKIEYSYNAGRNLGGNVHITQSEFKKILKILFNLESNWIQFISVRELKKHCLLALSPLHGGDGHGVVFDAKRRKILNPCRNSTMNYRLWSKDTKDKSLPVVKYNVYQCLEIQ